MRMRPLTMASVALFALSLLALAASPLRADREGALEGTQSAAKARSDAARIYLELGQSLIELHSASGGNMIGLVRREGEAKSLAGATCEPFVLTAPIESLDAMLPKFLTNEILTGAVMYFDANSKAIRRHEFNEARLTEITLDTLDAASKDPLRFTMTLAPATATVLTQMKIESKAKPPSPSSSRILASQFRVSIDGIASSRVTKVAGISLKRPNAPVGQSRSVSQLIEVSDVNLEVSISEREGFADWHRATVIERRTQPKSMRVDILDASLRTTVLLLEAPSVGIIALRDNPPAPGQVEQFSVEMYVNGWRTKPSRK